MGISPG
jgi:CRP-like cAMP-binding protein